MPNQLIVEGAITVRSSDPGSLPEVDAGTRSEDSMFGRPPPKSMTSYVRLPCGLQKLMETEEFDASVDDQADAPKIII